MLVAVNTSRGSAPARTALLGHGQVGTATGVVVHWTGGGDATQAPPQALQVANFFAIRSTATRATLRKRC
jgi:hypothetical protein